MRKRIISWMLCICMMIPVWGNCVDVYATETEGIENTSSTESGDTDDSMDVAAVEENSYDVSTIDLEEPPKATGLSIAPSATIALGQSVMLTGKASEDNRADASYRYIYYDGYTWHEIYSTDHVVEYNWVPTAAGSYVVCYQIICGSSVSNYMTTLKVEEPAFQLSGCKTSGNEGVLIEPVYSTNLLPEQLSFTYQIYDLSIKKWTTLEADTDETSCVWNPEKAGSYWIYVAVKDKSGMIDTNYCMGYVVKAPSITGLTISKKSPQVVKSTIELTGGVKNPIGEKLTYEYLSYDGKGWKSLYKADELKSVELYLDKAGDYVYCFQIYDSSNTVIGQWFAAYTVEPFYVDTKGISVKASANGGYDLTAAADTNDEDTVYKWMYYDLADKQWGIIKDWSSELDAHWQPKKEGTYWIHIEGKTSTGETDQTTIGYYVKGVSINSFTVDYASPSAVMNPITLSATVENPLSNELTYQYLAYDGKYWKELQSSDSLEDCVWIPEEAGSYLLCFQVIDEYGKVYQSFKGYQIDDIYVTFTNFKISTSDHLTYNICQMYNTNDRGAECSYLLYDLQKKVWSELGEGTSCTWKPTASGLYWIHAEVKTRDGRSFARTNGYQIKGFEITEFGFVDGRIEAGRENVLKYTGVNYLKEGYTVSIQKMVGTSWAEVFNGKDAESAELTWNPSEPCNAAYVCRVTDSTGYIVDEKTLTITPDDFWKEGWVYENGYKFYYINNVKQLDLDGILPKQSSYVIKVNRVTCTITVYAKDGDNGYIIPVKRFACSVGRPDSQTPLGTFYTLNKYRWHELNGPTYGQYCTRIVGGILFHSVPGATQSIYNIEAYKYNMLGYPASQGCVRLNVRNAKWIYDNCSLGTKVVIYDDSDPGPLGYGERIIILEGQNWDPTDPAITG